MDVPTFPAPPSFFRDVTSATSVSTPRYVISGKDCTRDSSSSNNSRKRHGHHKLKRLNNTIYPRFITTDDTIKINGPSLVTELRIRMTEKRQQHQENDDEDDADVICASGTPVSTKSGQICQDTLTVEVKDHVNNYTNRTSIVKSAGVQTRQCDRPYMLKVLPTLRDIIDQDDKASPKRFSKICSHLRFLGRLSLCQFGLAWLLSFWAVAGAAAFYATEGPREREQVVELKNMQRDLAVGLATELRQLRASEEEMEPLWGNKVKQYVAKHEKLLLEAVNSGYGEGGDTADGQLWTFPGCLLFSISLITTLGFGAPVPRTNAGRIVAVVFAAIGIPAHFLLVFNLGLLLAVRLQKFALNRKYGTTVDAEQSQTLPIPRWVKIVPFGFIASYYLLGIIGFGCARSRPIVASLLFPLDFTAAGGLGKTSSLVRIIYGLYLEGAVTIAAVAVAIVRVSATESLTNIGLKYGLLTEV